jgi:hypothetical protein
VGLRPEEYDCAEKAASLGLNTILWKEARLMRHKDKQVQFLLARADRIQEMHSKELQGLQDTGQQFPGLFEIPFGLDLGYIPLTQVDVVIRGALGEMEKTWQTHNAL